MIFNYGISIDCFPHTWDFYRRTLIGRAVIFCFANQKLA